MSQIIDISLENIENQQDYKDIFSICDGVIFQGGDTFEKYDFSAAETEMIVSAIEGHRGTSGEEPEETAARLAAEENANLLLGAEKEWRWRILFARTVLDRKRYDYYYAHKSDDPLMLRLLVRHSGEMLKEDAEAQTLFRERCGYYSCVPYNGENRWTHPPVDGGEPEKRI